MEDEIKTEQTQQTGKVETVESHQNITVVPTQEHFERRWHQIIDGHAYPVVQSFPGIRFNPITRKERAISQRIYEEKLAELREEDKKLRAQGKPGYLDELDIELELRDWCSNRGWNLQHIREKHSMYLKKIIAEAPFDRTRTSLQQFSPEELENLSPEAREKYEKEEAELQKRYAEWVLENTTPEEADIREKAWLVEMKYRELQRICLQKMAKAYADLCLMLINATDEYGNPYFRIKGQEMPAKDNTPDYRAAIRKIADDWDNLEVPEADADLLYKKWVQWMEGRQLDFMFP